MDKNYIAGLRNEYSKMVLNPADLGNEPLQALQQWFDLALAENLPEPNAMVLSTCKGAYPSSRIVLLKAIEKEGLVFYSNYQSRKGQELEQNPHASLLFFWAGLERQVRIEGMVERIGHSESTDYFQSRPRISQAGAIVSPQSKEIPDRKLLDEGMEELLSLPESTPLEKPENWGGYILVPRYMEFWQGRPGRVHDRICFERQETSWRIFRLAP